MNEAQYTLITAVAGATLVSTLVTFFVLRVVYSGKLRDMSARMDKIDKSRARTNEMLLQARRQTETLQKELVHARRPRPAAAANSAGTDTQAKAEALRRAKELIDEGDRTIVLQRPPQGFAETQPLSGFGPEIR